MRLGVVMGGDPWYDQENKVVPCPGELGDPARAGQTWFGESACTTTRAQGGDSSTQALVLQNEEHRAEGDSGRGTRVTDVTTRGNPAGCILFSF